MHKKPESIDASVPVPPRPGLVIRLRGLVPPSAASISFVLGITPLPAQAQAVSAAPSWLTIVLVLAALGGLVWHYRQTARRRALAADRLARENAWQQSLLESAGHGIVATDTTGTIVCFNRAAQHMLGYRVDEIVGKTTPAVLHDPEELIRRSVELGEETGGRVRPGFETLVALARRGGTEERVWTWVRKDGSRLPVCLSVTPVRDGAGVITGYLAIAADRSPRADDAERAMHGENALLRAAIDAMPGLYFQFDAEGRMLAWNRTYADTPGLADDEIQQMHALDVVHPEDVACALEKIQRVLSSGEKESAEIRVLARNGSVIPVLVTGGRVMSDAGPTLVGTAVDLTSRVAAEAALDQSRQEVLRRNESLQLLNELSRRLHGHLEVNTICEQAIQACMRLENTNHIAIYQLSADGEQLVLTHSHGFNEALRESFGVLAMKGTLAGLALSEHRLVHASDLTLDERITPDLRQRLADQHMYAAIIIPLIYDGRPLGTIQLAFQHRRGFGELELETLETLGKTLALALANAHHVLRLEHLAHHDALTGLPNRVILHREFERSLAAEAGRPRRMTLLLLDLDRFKEINDTLGHYVGDQLLRQVGPRLQPLLAQRGGLLCRLGGDEFAVLLPQSLASAEEEDYGRSLVTALRKPFTVNDMQLGVDASVGIALYPLDGADSHALMRSADVAMYAAKRTGRGVARYDRTLDRHSPERLAIIADLDEAIRDDQLLLHYQPKYDLKQGRITGFEALVRWLHPRLGLLQPEHFLHLAEMSEVIHALTERVLDLALADLRQWQDSGRDYGVAVNLSAQSLVDERFLVVLQDLLRKHAARPERLELEITETALMHDPERTAALLQRIAGLGVKLSIDDYGSGCSSLGYLHRLPIHALKIDRMFVRDMPVNQHDSIIVRSTVAMAHNLGLEVLAEGVEDGRTEAILRDMGCDQIQGFHISGPLPVVELTTWLATMH